ncbi:decaprenyl-phosphate phosphoribosyltransferase [Prevotella sp. AGR2160]|uniref:decaprenyl-phosphate phosphoribosyltransferase n=1 Tax=Prevotella sp. AGR2160 TaxID=1280674 RepID=UPI00041A47C7|nr:decaprenyl-phosphate phosphoribosyltransferase [Prevotella sp. AGR2160]
MQAYLKLIRPKQWVKNFFVFGPLFFGGELFNGCSLVEGLLTFLAYSCVASSIYCFNDIHDVADDRRHPEKCHRPIASGAISVTTAYGLMAVLFLLSLTFVGVLSLIPEAGDGRVWRVGAVIVFYWLMNLAYCARLKQYAVVDVCIVAFGFVLRLFAGGFATDVVLSKWIVLMTFLITLFMGFAKRRDDVLRMNATGEAPRKNTSRYNLTFINQAITITASVTLVCYIMYTVSPEVQNHYHNSNLYLTSVFVLIGLLRYIQVTVVDEKSGNPTKLILTDHFVQLDVLAWVLTFVFMIYGK